ncbi:MAG: prepilin-type N-terminal cleavage/methylation domain-containing protein [Gammaproteobacteria bacterium]|nr:prepilin-type N-terminal cleavage/methylation domain-containing protein [Gammaproteobacteria bacterium]
MIRGKRLKSGFTLIELLVVMVIVASLLTIAVPRYFRSLEHSKEVVLMQDLSVMRDALDQFYEDRGRYPETLIELADERYIRKVPVDPMTKSAESWILISRADSGVTGIYDVQSGAEGQTSKGIPYADL